jgi:hypothetical protein
VGKGVQVSTLDFPRIVVPLDTGLGRMAVHLALREKLPGITTNPEEFVSLAIDSSSGHA